MTKKMKIICCLLWLLALFCIGYFILMMLTIGPGFRFNYVWLLMGLAFIGMALTIAYAKKGFYSLPKGCIIGIQLIVLIGLLLFVLLEGMIVIQAHKQPQNEADYLIVLGAKVNGTKPSHILRKRIEKAYQYWEEHPGCKVIVSGGKGLDEGISEAECMKKELISLGMPEKQIITENQSTSTKENLLNCIEKMEEDGMAVEQADVIIVTTDFHVFRAVSIAKKLGYQKVEGLASKQVWYLIPTNYVREFLAVIKDFLVGNL